MAITDAESIRYVNEVVRPLCEEIRALKAKIDINMTTWHNGIGAIFTADLGGDVEDGREAEGVSRLTGNDVVNAVNQFESLQTSLDEAGVAQIISKPCVRTVRVE